MYKYIKCSKLASFKKSVVFQIYLHVIARRRSPLGIYFYCKYLYNRYIYIYIYTDKYTQINKLK